MPFVNFFSTDAVPSTVAVVPAGEFASKVNVDALVYVSFALYVKVMLFSVLSRVSKSVGMLVASHDPLTEPPAGTVAFPMTADQLPSSVGGVISSIVTSLSDLFSKTSVALLTVPKTSHCASDFPPIKVSTDSAKAELPASPPNEAEATSNVAMMTAVVLFFKFLLRELCSVSSFLSICFLHNHKTKKHPRAKAAMPSIKNISESPVETELAFVVVNFTGVIFWLTSPFSSATGCSSSIKEIVIGRSEVNVASWFISHLA